MTEKELSILNDSLAGCKNQIDSLLMKVRGVSMVLDEVKKKYEIALQGLIAIRDSGDCGGIAEKTLDEIDNME
tara:strand:- start:1073 stop:1291 length:219 start_codon:yes stop_codon:yes gene_type:complete